MAHLRGSEILGVAKMKRTFTASVWREDGYYIAQADAVDVARQGETEREALFNLQEALELYFILGGEDVDDEGDRGAVTCQIYIDSVDACEYPYSRIPVGAVVRRCNARAPHVTRIDDVSVRICGRHAIVMMLPLWGNGASSSCACGEGTCDPRVRVAHAIEVNMPDGVEYVERAITYYMALGAYYGLRGADDQVCVIYQDPGGSWVLGMNATDELVRWDSLEGAKDAAEAMADAAMARSLDIRQARSQTDDPVREAFRVLADDWKSSRSRGVDVHEMTAHPAYRSVIAMGEPAVYWILKRLETKSDHWFVALNAITGESPVPVESSGKMEEMAAAWLRWGRENGYAKAEISPAATQAVFERLADEWKRETAFMSSSGRAAEHPAHRAIVGMGRSVAPLILERMEARGGHWFHALESILGGSPVPAESLGDVEAMRRAWLEYGRGARWIA